MKKSPFALWFAAGLALVAAGCANFTPSRESADANRVVTGMVHYHGESLPSDAEVVVRLFDPAGTSQVRSAAKNDLPTGDRPKADIVPQTLGEQVIKSPGPGPVPFRIEYSADDALLRHGLNLEARISYGGRVRMRTVNFRAVTLSNSTDPQTVWVESASR